jgi:hypothetical protein
MKKSRKAVAENDAHCVRHVERRPEPRCNGKRTARTDAQRAAVALRLTDIRAPLPEYCPEGSAQ